MRDTDLRRYLEAAVPLSTLLLALMPVLGMRPMVLVIALWAVTLLLRGTLDAAPRDRSAWRWTIFLSLPFLFMVVDIVRAPDLVTGWHAVERGTAFLVFPVGWFLLGAPSSDRFREAMLDIFTLSAMLLAAYANGHILISGTLDHLAPDHRFSDAYRAAFSDCTAGLHPPYAAYYFLSAALFQVDRLLERARRPVLRLIAVAVLICAALLIASRMPLFAFCAGTSAILVVRLGRERALRWTAIITVAIGVLAVAVPSARQRIAEAIITIRHHDTTGLNSVSIRGPIAHCTMNVLHDHWLIGLGQCGVQPALDDCYRGSGMTSLLNGSYGTHNQLMHWWLCFGVAGLALYIVYFGTLLLRAWQRQDAVHLGFLVLLLICSATENLLARQWGVVLFACFNTLLLSLPEEVAVRNARASWK